MSYIDKTLLPDETILFRTKKHYIIFYMPIIWILMTVAFLLTPNDIIHKIAIAPAVVALVTALNQWLLYITSDFAVTNKRIVMREGFFFRHMNEMRLATVSNMTVNQSLIGQILGYGTVVVSPFGANSDVFTEIAKPFEFQKAAQVALDQLNK
ncbi:MAG: PH domain-containing protein [Gammaproteobacteria bacterium]|nr:PH domain-containing protein [Gammaproteobacteria bacterium]